jgi:hypothetical protein
MLEKSSGNVEVTNLRAILLLEADFNALNKIIFNNRVLQAIKVSNSIPKEVIGSK